jgi:hypothetical protein
VERATERAAAEGAEEAAAAMTGRYITCACGDPDHYWYLWFDDRSDFDEDFADLAVHVAPDLRYLGWRARLKAAWRVFRAGEWSTANLCLDVEGAKVLIGCLREYVDRRCRA